MLEADCACNFRDMTTRKTIVVQLQGSGESSENYSITTSITAVIVRIIVIIILLTAVATINRGGKKNKIEQDERQSIGEGI